MESTVELGQLLTIASSHNLSSFANAKHEEI